MAWTTIRSAISCFALAMTAAACASKMTREDMESWDGKTFRDLVEAWGVPDRQQIFENKRYYFWSYRGTQGSVNVPDVEASGATMGKGFGYHTESTRAFCDRTVQLSSDGVVEHVTWDGNACARYKRGN